jgi:hypothetical protein
MLVLIVLISGNYDWCLGGQAVMVAVPGEASETMVESCFWPSIVLVNKLAIYCDYIWYILRTTEFYVLGL